MSRNRLVARISRGVLLVATCLIGTLPVGAFAQNDGPKSNPAAEIRYRALIDNSPWYRSLREQAECGGIAAPDLRQKCIDSFGPRPTALPLGFVAPPPAPQAKAWTSPKE